jgi:hypothetical protein
MTTEQHTFTKEERQRLLGTRWGKGKAMGYNRYPSKHEPLDGCEQHENR